MQSLNISGGWILISAGIFSGMVIMPVFLKDSLLGGYASFKRRFIRLGHIAFVVLGIINILYGLMGQGESLPLLIGAVGMATGCIISGFWEPFKYVLVVPAVLVFYATSTLAWKLLQATGAS